ncbi:MAG: hypothetical protein L6R35_002819 [Caloplaca aegaea]|nr:MAG: hypothetical protein L6R35_002819 [Caloplaca aegaea]
MSTETSSRQIIKVVEAQKMRETTTREVAGVEDFSPPPKPYPDHPGPLFIRRHANESMQPVPARATPISDAPTVTPVFTYSKLFDGMLTGYTQSIYHGYGRIYCEEIPCKLIEMPNVRLIFT